ncbi:MAG: HAMP domain-containing histidine kinase [Spirochaetaceae bacterium]|jgi:signal transduction histidine kinase|nr:HAMP domain-containing histidine kinase [Spirochaetaceae bacterium]
MISLKNRLSLTYAVFISIALLILTLIINRFTDIMFSRLIRDNIRERSGEIVSAIAEQYNPYTGFDTVTLQAMGMYFVHEGYIITIEDSAGYPVWDARSCDMQQCTMVLSAISDRMENQYRLKGAWQNQGYPVFYLGERVGKVNIETYGPFFYSETELVFLSSLNRLLLIAGVAFILLSVGVSILLASSVARPIRKAGEAARHIARQHAGGMSRDGLSFRINDTYKTRELNELSRSINDLARELEEGERRQKQLTADIAHELRTPLTCLQGNIEAMIDGVWEPTEERLVSCHEEIIRLTALVEDLKLLTSLEWEKLNLEKTGFDLARLVRLTAEQFLPAAREKGIEMVFDLRPCPVDADYNRLKQVFINLLSNAVKYTDAGTISLRAAPLAGEGGPEVGQGWEFTIADTGIGISPEELPHIFERFYRSDKSRSRNTGGAGIGLTIAAAIIRAHGGSIKAESTTGGGSTFRVTLPG